MNYQIFLQKAPSYILHKLHFTHSSGVSIVGFEQVNASKVYLFIYYDLNSYMPNQPALFPHFKVELFDISSFH